LRYKHKNLGRLEHMKCVKFKTNFSTVKYLKLARSENNIVKLLNYRTFKC